MTSQMLYTLLYLEVIKKPLTMASHVAQMNGKKEKGWGEGRQPLLQFENCHNKEEQADAKGEEAFEY